MNKKRNELSKRMLLTLVPMLFGCSTFAARANETDSNHVDSNRVDSGHSDAAEMHKLFSDLNSRLQSLEAKISTLNEKLDGSKASAKGIVGRAPSSQHSAKLPNPPELLQPTGVIQHPSSSFGTDTEVTSAKHDPESGFVNDEAVKLFRKAIIFYQAQKYPESVLTFSDFLEKFPDHALAGSAQFYVGESYVHQKEYRLAIQEFQRVLTSYDRSPHVADTLNEMAYSEEALKKTTDAAKHRQLLSSLFPNAPAMAIQNRMPEIEKIQSLDNPPIVATSTRAPLVTDSAAPLAQAGTTLDQPPSVPRNSAAIRPVLDTPTASITPVVGSISAPISASGSVPIVAPLSAPITAPVNAPMTAPISEPISAAGSPNDFHPSGGQEGNNESGSTEANEINEGAPLPNQ